MAEDKPKKPFPTTNVAAIVMIAVMQCFALARGMDGPLLMSSVIAIAGLAGYQAQRNSKL